MIYDGYDGYYDGYDGYDKYDKNIIVVSIPIQITLYDSVTQ